MNTAKLNTYEVTVVTGKRQAKKTVVVGYVKAETHKAAYTMDNVTAWRAEYPAAHIVIYPVTDGNDDGTLNALAARVVRQIMRRRLCNNRAVNAALTTSTWDVEDMHGDAVLGILETLRADPAAPMHVCADNARREIMRKYQKMYRISGTVKDGYNPERMHRNVYRAYRPRQTSDLLAAAVRAALENCDLTERQATALRLIMANVRPTDAMQALDINSRNAWYKLTGKAKYKALDSILQYPGALVELEKIGVKPKDIKAIRDKLEKYTKNK